MVKMCFNCKVLKPISEFNVRRSGRQAGQALSYCRPCCRERRKVLASGVATAYRRLWRMKHPDRWRAHKLVELALDRGDMTRQPCSVCGLSKAQAHHEDYSKPLDVIWLCHAHHMERHREIKTKDEPEKPSPHDHRI